MINNNKEKETDGHTGIIHSSPPSTMWKKNKGYLQTIHFKNLNDLFTTRKEYIYTS